MPEITIDMEQAARLAATDAVEWDMPEIRCPQCVSKAAGAKLNVDAELNLNRAVIGIHPSTLLAKGMQLDGVLTCLKDGYQWPITLLNDTIVRTAQEMPGSEAQNLHGKVPEGLVEDIQEAERCHFANSLKAAAVMCRRALQLGLEDRGVTVPGTKKPTLGLLLGEARKKTPPLLHDDTFMLADGIKDIGDAGAHQRGTLDERDASMLIHVSVRVLNELFPETPA